MTLIPPPGPQRTRQMVLWTVLGLAVLVWVWRAAPWRAAQNPAVPPAAASNPLSTPPRAGTQGKPTAVAAMPEPVNLPKLEPVPDEPGAGRNLFRFGVRPPPVAPKAAPEPVRPPPPPPPPQPTGPPPIDLQLKGIIHASADSPRGAWLKDPKLPPDARMMFGVEGQIVDGKYKLLKVGTESVIVCYVDGTGQRTIMLPPR